MTNIVEIKPITYDEQYYELIMREFGYDPLSHERFTFNLGNLTKEELASKWLCHDGGSDFAHAFSTTGDGIVATGFGLSGTPHIGTVSQVLRSIRLQKAGLPVSMVLGDLDAYNNKNTPLSQTQELADKFERFIENVGFSADSPSILRRQIDDNDTLLNSYLIGRYVDDDLLCQAEEDLYGNNPVYARDDDARMLYRRKMSLCLMTADFLNLRYKNGYSNIMIMLGVDEHRFVRLAQEVNMRASQDETEPNFFNKNTRISGLYTSIIKGLNDYPKMSKSFKGSGITLDMNPDEISQLVMSGEGSYEGFYDNVVYQMLAGASELTIDELTRAQIDCSERNERWRTTKREYADYLVHISSVWKNG